MAFVSRMRRRYPGVAIGYSGHEPPDDTAVVTVAVSLGATILERHEPFLLKLGLVEITPNGRVPAGAIPLAHLAL